MQMDKRGAKEVSEAMTTGNETHTKTDLRDLRSTRHAA